MKLPLFLIASVNSRYSSKCLSASASGMCSIIFSAKIRHRNFIVFSLMTLSACGRDARRRALCLSHGQFPRGTHLDAPHARRWNLRRQLDGFVQVRGVDQVEPGELLLGLGEGTIGHG